MQKVIQSISDPLVVFAKDLNRLSTRSRLAKHLIYGEQHIQFALQSGITIENIFYGPGLLYSSLLKTLLSKKLNCHSCTEEVMKFIAEEDHCKVVAVASAQRDLRGEMTKNCVLVFDNVEEHKKIGEAIHVASQFGIEDSIATQAKFDVNYSEVLTASHGKSLAMKHRSFSDIESAIHFLRRHNYQIVVAKADGNNTEAMAQLQARPVALVLGHEDETLNTHIEDFADIVVQMPETRLTNNEVATYESRLNILLTMLNQKMLLGSKHHGMHISLNDQSKNLSWAHEETVRWLLLLWLAAEGEWSDKQWQEVRKLLSISMYEVFEKSLFSDMQIAICDTKIQLADGGLSEIRQHWKLSFTAEKKLAQYVSTLSPQVLALVLKRTRLAQEKLEIKYKVAPVKEEKKKIEEPKKASKSKKTESANKSANTAMPKPGKIGPREKLMPVVVSSGMVRPVGPKS